MDDLDQDRAANSLCGLAAVHQGRIGPRWLALIAFGTTVMAFGVNWAYNL